MKSTYKTAAQVLLVLAECLTAVAQSEINPDHFPDQDAPAASAPRQEAQIRTLQQQLESYERQLRAKAEQAEAARQEAISAGIQGDGAGSSIDASRQEQKELEVLQAALAPEIERTRKMIASLTTPAPPTYTAPGPKMTPVGKARPVVAAGNSRVSKQDKGRTMASNNTSKLNPAGR